MAQRCILKTRAQMDGAIRDPGYVFILPTGIRGPHRATRASHEQINNASGLYERYDADRGQDEPLYDVLEEIPDVGEPTLAQKIRIKQGELETVKREEIEAKRVELEGTGPRSTELAKEIRDMQAQHRAELREPPGPIDKGHLPLAGETEAETQRRIHSDPGMKPEADMDAGDRGDGDSRDAGNPAKSPFVAPEAPVVRTIPPLVGQKPSADRSGLLPAELASSQHSGGLRPEPGKPGPGAPAHAPSKPVMAQPADAPAEKGKTERMDGSF